MILQKWQSLEPPTSTPGEERNMRLMRFFWKFYSEQLLFEPFFDIIRNFYDLLPKVNTYSPIETHVKIIATHSLNT